MGKKLAIIGSSGGNLYNLGGKEPLKLLGEIFTQARQAGMTVGAVQFIGAKATMDNIKESAAAELYVLGDDAPALSLEASLDKVNAAALEKDAEIARMIQNGEIDGLVIMSGDPDKINKQALKAAAEKAIPVVGTGGTSVAKTQSMRCRVISASGTTGTTNRTRAIGFITALSKEWGLKYRPAIGSSSAGNAPMDGNVWKRINLRGIMLGALPGFISMALILAVSKIPGLEALQSVFDVIIGALPVIVAAIAAKQVSGLDEVGIVAGIIAGSLSSQGGLIGGIVGGIIAGLFAYWLVRVCFHYSFPATTANIVAGGLAGLGAGLLGYYLLAPVAGLLGDRIRLLIESILSFNTVLAGLVAGLLIWPAILGGIYHAAILPIVLFEMEKTGQSFLGAVDMTSLVMVSAGITLANIVYPKNKGEAAVATPGFLINMGFGTFVEAAYPFMFSDKIVFAGAIIAGGSSGALVGLFNVRGTAYVPSPMAPFLSSDAAGLLAAMLAGAGVAFLITLYANRRHKKLHPAANGKD